MLCQGLQQIFSPTVAEDTALGKSGGDPSVLTLPRLATIPGMQTTLKECPSPRWVRGAIAGPSGELAVRTVKHLRSVREGGALVVVDQQRGYSVEQRARAAALHTCGDGSQARLRPMSLFQ